MVAASANEVTLMNIGKYIMRIQSTKSQWHNRTR